MWTVANPSDERLEITLDEVLHDSEHELGTDPGLVKDGVEAHLQELLAEHVGDLRPPVATGAPRVSDRDRPGRPALSRRRGRDRRRRGQGGEGEIDVVEQLTRYLGLLNRDPLLAPVRGLLAAQEIRPRARTLALDRGIACRTVDYDALRGLDDPHARLF